MILTTNKISKRKLGGQLSNQFLETKKSYRRELLILNSKNSFESSSNVQLSEETKELLRIIVEILTWAADINQESVKRMIQTSSPEVQEILIQLAKKFGLTPVKMFIILCYGPEMMLSNNLIPMPLKRLLIIPMIVIPKLACFRYIVQELQSSRMLRMQNNNLGLSITKGTHLTPMSKIRQLQRWRSIFLLLTIANFIGNEIIDFNPKPNPHQITIYRTILKFLPTLFFAFSRFTIYYSPHSVLGSLKLFISKDLVLMFIITYCLGLPSITGVFLLLTKNININPVTILLPPEIGDSRDNQQVSTNVRSRPNRNKSKTFHRDFFNRQNEVKTFLPDKKNNLAPKISPEIAETYKDYFPEKFPTPPVK